MDDLLDQVREVAEGQIDFEGQRLCDWLATLLLCAVGAISFAVGYVLQDIKLAVYIVLGGSLMSALVVIPPWPFFNRNPVRWLPVGAPATVDVNVPQSIVLDAKVTL